MLGWLFKLSVPTGMAAWALIPFGKVDTNGVVM